MTKKKNDIFLMGEPSESSKRTLLVGRKTNRKDLVGWLAVRELSDGSRD